MLGDVFGKGAIVGTGLVAAGAVLIAVFGVIEVIWEKGICGFLFDRGVCDYRYTRRCEFFFLLEIFGKEADRRLILPLGLFRDN
jgi:hypothetical protein